MDLLRTARSAAARASLYDLSLQLSERQEAQPGENSEPLLSFPRAREEYGAVNARAVYEELFSQEADRKRVVAAAGRRIYIPLAPPEAYAALHSAYASAHESRTYSAHDFAESVRLSAAKRAAVQTATSPLSAARGAKGITH